MAQALLMEVMNALVDWKKIPSVSQTLVRSWGYGLTGLTENQVRKGLELTKDHVGFFDLGVFRQLCRQQQASYQQPAQLPPPSKTGNARFRELCKVTDAMKAEVGKGPITRATLDNRLTANFIRGKSAQQIIDYCQKLYA